MLAFQCPRWGERIYASSSFQPTSLPPISVHNNFLAIWLVGAISRGLKMAAWLWIDIARRIMRVLSSASKPDTRIWIFILLPRNLMDIYIACSQTEYLYCGKYWQYKYIVNILSSTIYFFQPLPWLIPNLFPHVSRIAAQIRCICTGHMGWPIQRQGALESERSFGFAVVSFLSRFNSVWFIDWLWTWFSQFTLSITLLITWIRSD